MKSRKIMYSLFIEKDLLGSAKETARIAGTSTSVYVREAIIEKVNSGGKLAELEERIKKLEKKIF